MAASLVLALSLFFALTAVAPAAAQERVVSGTVVAGHSLRPLDGVEVRILGTELRTHTDAGGRFLFRVGPGADSVTIELRWLGYRPLTKTVAVGDPGLRIALTEVALELNAVIVTGTATEIETRAIGNDVGTILAGDVLRTAPVSDVQQVLTARVPGVVIAPYQGNVGTGGVTRVRGVASLSVPNEPLIYVDGIRADADPHTGPNIRNGPQIARINDLNPEDIAQIQIVKGPAAATLFGTGASHGVVQILTRQGTPGRPILNVTVRQGANWFMDPAGRLNPVHAREAGHPVSLDLYQQEVAAGRPIFQAGHLQSYAASLSGGSQAIRYYVSSGLDLENGVVDYNWRHRLTSRANITLLPRDNLSIQANLGVVRGETRLAQGADLYDLMTQFWQGSPLKPATRGFARVPPEDAATIDARDQVARIIGGLQLRHQPWRWLTHRLTIGGDQGNTTSSQLFPRDPAGASGPFLERSLGEKTVDTRESTLRTFDYAATASVRLAPALSSAVSFGAQYHTKRLYTVTAMGRGFPVGVSEIGGAAVTTSGSQVVENNTLGGYAQEQLGWKNRVFVTGGVRVDDNSAFGANFDVVTYPKVSASWVVSEEPWWRPMPVNALRLRAAWGRAGQQPDEFAATRSYQPITGPGDVPTLTPQNLGNPDLKPERGEELELGFDAGLWNDRANLTFTYYSQRTRDAIVPAPAPPSLGFPGNQLVNVGLIRNWGVELSLDAHVVSGHTVTWDVGGTLASNDSRVESLGGIAPFSLTSVGASLPSGQWVREGYPVGAYFLRSVVSAERGPDGGATNILCAGGPQNGNRFVACDTAPLVYLGKPTPSWTGTLRTTLRVAGNLSLNALVDYRGGYMVYDNDVGVSHFGVRNTNAINANPYSGSSSTILLAYDNLIRRNVAQINNVALSVVKGGFMKLREVSATYALPTHWAARLGARHATVTVAGRNLVTLWRAQSEVFGLKLLDPETRSPQDISGRTFRQLPQYAQFVFAARLTF